MNKQLLTPVKPIANYALTFSILQVLIFGIYGIWIALFEKLDNEIFTYLLYTTLIFGTATAGLQIYFYNALSKVYSFTRISFYAFALIIELAVVNLLALVMGGYSLTYYLFTKALENQNWDSSKSSVMMHVSILLAILFVAAFMPKPYIFQSEGEE